MTKWSKTDKVNIMEEIIDFPWHTCDSYFYYHLFV